MCHTAARFRVSLRSRVPPVPSRTPRNEYPLLSFPASSCGWKIPQHLQRAPAPRPCTGTLPETPLRELSPEPGKPLWLPGCLGLLHLNQKLAAYSDLLTFSIALGASRKTQRERERGREREKERGTRALCFHICAHDVKWICLIEFMTQREPRGWEVESGGGRIKFAPDFYTRDHWGKCKAAFMEGFRLNGAEWEGVRFAWLPPLAASAPPRTGAEVWVPALGSKPRRLLCIDNGRRSQERGEAQNRGHLALGRAGGRQREIIGA